MAIADARVVAPTPAQLTRLRLMAILRLMARLPSHGRILCFMTILQGYQPLPITNVFPAKLV